MEMNTGPLMEQPRFFLRPPALSRLLKNQLRSRNLVA
jgi:hypothetical protein